MKADTGATGSVAAACELGVHLSIPTFDSLEKSGVVLIGV